MVEYQTFKKQEIEIKIVSFSSIPTLWLGMKPNMINICFLGGCDKDFEAMKDSNTLKKYVMDPVWRK